MSKEFTEEQKANVNENADNTDYAYKNVIRDKHQRRTWSVVSFALAVLSLIFLFWPWVSLALGLVSVGAAAISRKNLGYFDKISLASMIIAIFGVVFAIVGVAFGDLIFEIFS